MPKLQAKTPEQKAWLKGRHKYVSGFCNNVNKPAQCEGTKPKSNGKPLPTCGLWLECPCECHWRVDEMFRMTGMERVEVPNPEYIPVRGHFVMPDPPADPVTGIIASSPLGVMAPDGDEDGYAAPPRPAQPPLVTRRTPLGYAARGTLEAQVWEAVRQVTPPITTLKVVDFIAEKYHVPTPSRGAVQAVWKRWQADGYGILGTKPVQFLGFVKTGTWEELERIKVNKKRQKQQAASKLRRGYRD